MQGRRSIFDPFSETVDLNQGSSSNITGTNESNNRLSPMERRLLNNDLASELNFSCTNTTGYHNSRSFSSWDVGESSSRANIQNWPPSFGADSRSEERQLESSNIHSSNSLNGGQLGVGPSNMQSSGSNRIPEDLSLNLRFEPNNIADGGHGIGFTDVYESGRPETEGRAVSAGFGTSSESESDSSLGNWGSSCKRKALEGTSGQAVIGESSSFSPQAANIVRHAVPVRHNGVTISPPVVNPPTMNHQEQPNTRNGVGLRVAASDPFSQLSAPAAPANMPRIFGMRESVPSNTTSNANPIRRSNVGSHQIPRRMSLNEFLERTSRGEVIATSPSNPSIPPPPSMNAPGIPRNAPTFPWDVNVNSRSDGSSSSAAFPGERGSEANFRSAPRNNTQPHNFVSSNVARNTVQDPTSWSLATGSASANGGGAPSSSRNGSGSGSRSVQPFWVPQNFSTTQSQQRSSEIPPWSLFPLPEPESGSQRGHFSSFPAGSSSTAEDNLIPSGVNRQGRRHQPHSMPALLREAFAVEGRQRLVSEIRYVLNAMRRGENVRPEDYLIFDPIINEMIEMHDRHRDMRLDVDNMSYEELLALEERIGNVNTGLSEDVILRSLKQRKYMTFMGILPPNSEPCCICQEEYAIGDKVGTLDCGHEFHTDCIKQWLAQKNVCPICKMTGLAT